MTRTAAGLVMAGVLIGGAASALRADVTAEQVRQAMDRGVAYLKSQQLADGSWPDFAVNQVGGMSGLCTLALLNAGVGPEDDSVRRALAWLRQHRFESGYSVSLQTMVFCKAEPAKDMLLIQRNVEFFERNQITVGPTKGSWAYPGSFGGGVSADGDNSNTQFALLALHEAERLGAEVRPATWRMSKAYFEDCQNPDGSWGYKKAVYGTGSMTCAGITSMIIVDDAVHQPDAGVDGEKILCCGQGKADDAAVRRGFEWLERHFSVTRNPGQRAEQYALYYLYGVERVGRLTAQRFIGEHDWYREGADHLVNEEIAGADYWKGEGFAETNEMVATSFALLFLSKGRRPVLLAKARHDPGNDWNQHRGDVANLTAYVESKWKRDMTWQVIDLRLATVDDLLQSPVLYLSGKEDPLPRDEAGQQRLARNLRDYLDRGGFLFAESNCDGKAFDKAFRALMEKVFPEPEYRLRLLDPEHPVWHAEQPVKPDQLRQLWGIDFGCRTSVVYAPPDPPDAPRASLSCLWELSRPGRLARSRSPYPDSVRAQTDGALAIGINVLAYATNRELRPKDEIPRQLTKAPKSAVPGRGQVAIANLRHPGGCNAAPRALATLLETAGTELKMRTPAEGPTINITDDALFDYHLVFMQGRTAFRLTDAERRRLRQYVDRGGMVFANSICASEAFTESFRREMAAVFADHPLEPVAPTDAMLTPAYGGFDLSTVTRHDPEKSAGPGPLKATERKVAPTLEGVKVEDRWVVVFSPYDISCALEKHNSLECRGYTRQDAARIALNVLLYSLQQ
ncbi:MAG: DUF4159 domain-containing protein [Planctomycetia bacterium]|nr:DUF4159 domain-containing protein [Planctomycetia bacterium]